MLKRCCTLFVLNEDNLEQRFVSTVLAIGHSRKSVCRLHCSPLDYISREQDISAPGMWATYDSFQFGGCGVKQLGKRFNSFYLAYDLYLNIWDLWNTELQRVQVNQCQFCVV